MNKITSFQKLYLALTLLALLSSCGNSEKASPYFGGSANFASENEATINLTASECSHDIDDNPNLAIRAKVVSNGVSIDPGFMSIKISRFSNDFGQSDGNVIKFWARTVSGSEWGSWEFAEFFLEVGNTRSPNSYAQLNWGEIKELANRMGLNTNVSANELIGQFKLLVRLPRGASEKILTLQTYSMGGEPREQTTVLLPSFVLDPKQYRSSQPAILFDFHPFKNMVDQNYQSAQLVEASRQFCF